MYTVNYMELVGGSVT